MTTSPNVNVQTLLNESKFSPFQWIIFAICFLIVLLDGFDTAAIGYIAPSLLGEWKIDRTALAPVLSAALFGLAFGALASGPLADRFGRKAVLLASVLIFGSACLASAWSGGLTELVTLRFITGLGLGAAMPNAATLMSEYCPDGRRATLTNAMFCGFPVGAAFGGFVAAWMIPNFGWRSVLVAGGIAPLLLLVVMLLLLPESVRYMVTKRQPVEKIRKVLSKITASASQAASFVLTERAPATSASSGIGVILSPAYLVGTLSMWVAYFMGLVVFYSLISWMPILFKDAGMDQKTATLISALFPLGGLGAIAAGMLMDRMNPNKIVAAAFALGAVGVWAIGQSAGNLGVLMIVVLAAGTVLTSSQTCLPALAADFYPTAGRATGVSSMLGIGRFGGVAGPFLVAQLQAWKMGFGDIFMVVAIPALIAAAALMVKHLAHPQADRSILNGTAKVVGH